MIDYAERGHPPVVLLHALPRIATVQAGSCARRAPNSAVTAAAPPGEYSFEPMCDDAVNVIVVGPATLIGRSVGGAVANSPSSAGRTR